MNCGNTDVQEMCKRCARVALDVHRRCTKGPELIRSAQDMRTATITVESRIVRVASDIHAGSLSMPGGLTSRGGLAVVPGTTDP